MATDVIRLLKESGTTVGVAESLTGGGVMSALTSVPGPSSAFPGAVAADELYDETGWLAFGSCQGRETQVKMDTDVGSLIDECFHAPK